MGKRCTGKRDINRITVEFKLETTFTILNWVCILIESQWNLNDNSGMDD